jgi:hypothetical protein
MRKAYDCSGSIARVTNAATAVGLTVALAIGLGGCGGSHPSGPGLVITNDTASATKIVEASVVSDPASASSGLGCLGTAGRCPVVYASAPIAAGKQVTFKLRPPANATKPTIDGLLGLYIGSVNSHRCALLPTESAGTTYRLNLSEIEKDDQSC